MARHESLLLASLLIFTLLIAVDATSVILAVSGITEALGGSATESFWIGASYLLAMCVSQPILCGLSDVFGRTSVLLSSILLLGIGSLACAEAEMMALLLAGRSVQGLGAGGLTVLSYVTFGGLESKRGVRFLTGMSLFLALGTVCGPLIGAVLGNNNTWRWIFRLNLPVCLVLGVTVYTVGDQAHQDPPERAKLADLDFAGVALFAASVTLSLAGLSFGGTLFEWTDWRTIVPISLGGFLLLLFVAREWFPASFSRTGGGKKRRARPILNLSALGNPRAAITFSGAAILGMLMFTLLFFLPIYYRVVKGHSQSATGLLLLPQTLAIAPCACLVFILVGIVRLPSPWVVLLGWLCATCGAAILAMLGPEKSLSSDILLNLPSGIGIGVLLPALALSAKGKGSHSHTLHAAMLLVFLRYLGSACGLIITGILFQHALRHELASTKFGSTAGDMTRHATELMHSVRDMPDSEDKTILIHATSNSLRIVWVAMAAVSCAAFLLSSCALFSRAKSKQGDQSTSTSLPDSGTPVLELPKGFEPGNFKSGLDI